MRKFTLLLLGLVLVAGSTLHAQDVKKSTKGSASKFDTRIDNMGYWMEKAKEGLVPYNPPIPVKPEEFKGSEILVDGVLVADSPDVPVTNLTNVTESENSIFVDPDNNQYVLNSNNSTSWSGSTVGSLYGANYFQSSNGGSTWGGSYNGAGGANSGDPTTAINFAGRQFVNYIDNPGGQGIAYSDNGINWTPVTIAPNPGSLADKNHMWIDNSPSSTYVGNLYVSWTDFGGTNNNNIVISRSTNAGLTWSALQNLSSAVSAGSHNQGVNIQTGHQGQVYVCWAIYDGWPTDETAIGFAKSTNGGVSYIAGSRVITNIKGIRNSGSLKSHRVNSFPSMAVDISGGSNNGNIYIVWTNVGTPGVNTGTNRSVYMKRSTDGGSTWSAANRVNQGTFADGKSSYFPWITCDPATGALAVIFYDDRYTSSSSCETWVAYSLDAGNTWTDFRVSDASFTPTAISGLASSYMGDYLGITARGNYFYPCWTQPYNGTFMTMVSPFTLGLNAAFTANNTIVCSGSSIIFTDQSSGPPTSWSWSFIGGTPSTATGIGPHTITYSTPGTYNVSLTVGDGSTTDTETKTGYITVQNVFADFTGSPTTVVIGNTVTFTNNSSCNPTAWSWSFPGGTPSTATGVGPHVIIYNTLGTYDVSLTVTKGGSNDTEMKTGYITVSPPEFNMTNGTVTTCTGNFYDSGGPSGNYQNNENYTETFYPSTPGAMIRFTFTSFNTESGYDYFRIYNGINTSAPLIGTYNGTTGPGTVTASNASGAITFNFTSDVSVTPAGWSAAITCYSTTLPPVANFSASNTTPFIGETVNFSDLSNNAPTSWAWSFNPTTITYVGGTNANSPNPQVQFNAAGLYSVTLAVSNTYGSDSEIKSNYINAVHAIPPYVDGFESFASGNYVALTSPYWTTWTNLPGGTEDAVIVSTPTHSGTKSVKIDGANDLVLPLGAKTSGKYVMSFYMYIPSGYYGYYNLLQLFNGASSQWGAEVFFSTSGAGYGNAGGSNSFTFTYGYNTWLFVKNMIDLDIDQAQIWLNGSLLKQWQWSLGALGTGTLKQLDGIDMYAWNVNGTPLYYFDDISYYEIVQLDLTALLQGPYNGSAMVPNLNGILPLAQPYNVAPWNYNGTEIVTVIPNANVVDWMLIELRDAATAGQANSGTIVGRQAAFLLNNGKVVGLDGSSVLRFESPIFNNLFAVVHHRNHISVMSANPVTKTAGIYTYNFSTGSGQAYGGVSAHKQIAPGVWGMYGGDGTKDGSVGLTDESPAWEVTAGTKGYLGTDYNLNTQTDNMDKDDIWAPNLGAGSQVPN